jgi:Na+-transporting methylmalonyl-CoA/oxaloacetate decarboxylase gamma subunit
MNFLRRIWNVYWLQWNWTAKAISIGVLAVLIILVIVGVRSCGKHEPKFNQKEVTEAQNAVETHNVEKQKEVLAKSDVREEKDVEQINEGDAATKQAIEDAKHKYDGITNDELAAELEKRK